MEFNEEYEEFLNEFEDEDIKIENLDDESKKLIFIYVTAYASILKLLEKQIDKDLSVQQSQGIMKEISDILEDLKTQTKDYAENIFPSFYFSSLKNVDDLVVNLEIVKGSGVVHKKALEKAISDLYSDLAKRTTFMEQQAKRIIRENAKELITAMIQSGESYDVIKRQLKEKLLIQGVPAFIDAGKKKWQIDKYVDMVIRTKSRILHNEGTINRLREYQVNSAEYDKSFDLIQISNHNSSDWCFFYEDMVFSVSGQSDKYPSIETLPNRPYNTLHPNCKHIFLVYISSFRGEGNKVDKKYQNISLKELNKLDYDMRKKSKP